MNYSRRTVLAAAMAAGALLGGGTMAQGAYPDKPIKLIVPNPPGGTTDLLARLIAAEISTVTGQQVVVDNRAGAGGGIAAQLVAKSPADGYTLMMVNINSHMLNSALIKNLPYHPTRDFAPITIVGSTPNVLLASTSFTGTTLADVIAQAKAKPGELSFGSTSPGGSPHMSGEMLKSMAGVKLVHVPYKGAGPMLSDLMGNQIPLAFDNLPSSMSLIKSGKVRAIAITTPKRWPGAPEIPTIAESGLPGYDVSAWFGLAAPAGTPKPVVDRLHTIVAGILKEPRVSQKLFELGASPGGITPEEFTRQIQQGIERWSKIAEEAGIRADQ